MKKIIFILLITTLSFSMAQAQGKGFKDVVNNIEKQYKVKKVGIPLMGLANFFVKVARPGGARNFKLAVFEGVKLSELPEEGAFDSMMSAAFLKDKQRWQRAIVVNSLNPISERVIIYLRPSGKKDFEVAIFTVENSEIVLVQAKFNSKGVMKFIQERTKRNNSHTDSKQS